MPVESTQIYKLVEEGYCSLGEVINKQKCRQLLEFIKSTRNFGMDLFIEEEYFRSNPQYKGVNPCPGRNILEGLDISFIECNEIIHTLLSEVLGQGYLVVLKKVICGVPKEWIPNWVLSEINSIPVANLGAFIKPQYRDITYFHGIDFHQDIIDYKNRRSDFITLYVYLDDVSEVESPLFIIPRSHIFGVTAFPHDLVPSGHASNGWVYSNRQGNYQLVLHHILTGSTGSVWFWHPCLLHGTQPTTISRSRISLRYIIERSASASSAFLDYVNSKVKGPLSLESTRIDLNENGKSILRGNIINENAKA